MVRTSQLLPLARTRVLLQSLLAATGAMACSASVCPPGQPECTRLCVDPVGRDQYCRATGGIPAVGTCKSSWTCQDEVWAPQLTSGTAYSSSQAPYWEPSMAISGDSVALASRQGAVQVFTRKDGAWGLEATLSPTTEEPFLAVGASCVAVSGDTLAAGIPQLGVVLVYTRDSGVWTLQARLDVPNPSGYRYDLFGTSVALDGDMLAVGAPDDRRSGTRDYLFMEAGAVYLFGRTGDAWVQTAFLKAPAPWAGDRFGSRVALSGDTLAVAAPGDSSPASGVNGPPRSMSGPYGAPSGAVYVFQRESTGWSQQAYLKADSPQSGAAFGASLALDGDALAVGAPYHGPERSRRGAVYGFTRAAGSWAQEAVFASPGGDCFGYSVALWGDTVAVGRCALGSPYTSPYLFADDVSLLARAPGAWSPVRTFVTWGSERSTEFGRALALGPDVLFATAAGESKVLFLRP